MTDTENLPVLPEKWRWITIKDIVYEVKGNVTPQDDILYELYSVPAFENQKPEYLYGKDIGSDKKPVKSEDVLLCKINPRINRVWIVKNNGNSLPQIASKEYLSLRTFSENVPYPQYLMWYFRSPDFREWIKVNVSGVTGSHTRAKTDSIISQYIPLPPLPEQNRIVQKIEELFTYLDAGVKELEKAKVQIKNYRQAILKTAFKGKLTEEWRERNPNVEDSKCILRKVKSQVPIKSQSKRIQNLQYDKVPYELPFKWNWASLGDVSISITDGDHQAPPKSESGVPFILISNISSGKLDMSKTMYVPEEYYENIAANRKPQPRDLLYSVTGSYGIPILISKDHRFCFQRHIALIRPHTEISSKYLYYVLKSPLVYTQATKAATGTAQLTVPLLSLRLIKIPFPPIPEQQAIVQEIESRFSVVDQIEKIIDKSSIQAEKLHQSILKKAFEGKLVSQDLNDEPASLLIKRINEEKDEFEIENKVKRKRTSNLRTKNMGESKDSTKEIRYFGLYEILCSSKKSLTPKELWELSKLDIEDFYYELKIEVEKGRIIENRPNDIDVYLEISE